MRVVTPRHIAYLVQDWTVPEGKRDKKVTRRTQLQVLDALWECNKRGQMHVFPRIEVIAEYSGLRSRQTISLALTALEAQGFIRALSPRNGGRGHPTVWGLVDNPVNHPLSGRFTGEKAPAQRQKAPAQRTESTRSAAESTRWAGTQGRENEERREERMKREPPLRLVDPPEPPRACRMPGCDHPAVTASRCLRHAAGLPFPLPAPPDGLPAAPTRRAEIA